MIWLTWRQFRAQAVTAAAALAAFAILLAATSPRLASLYAASGLSGCHPARCADLASGWLTQLNIGHTYFMLYELTIAVILLAPACSGAPRWSRANWRPAPRPWPGTSPSPGPGGWRPSSPSAAWPPWRSPRA
jgi:hypothetical protein